MIKLIFDKKNLLYAFFLLIASIYLVSDNGWSSYFNYVSILLALFLPIFILIQAYKIVRQALVCANINKSDIYNLAVLISIALAAYFIGLEKSQRIILVVIDAILCFIIFLIMLYISRKNRKL